MPCYEIVTASVEFKVRNQDLFEKTLKRMGFQKLNERHGVLNVRTDEGNDIAFDLANGKVSSEDYRQTAFDRKLNAFKRAYSVQAIEEMAKKKKWILKQQSVNTFQLKRF